MARTLGKHALVLLLITQIQFSHFSNAQETQPELCYQVAWGVGSTYRRHVIRPVTAFPAEHALVTEQYCGGKQAGDAIPHDALWSTRGYYDPAACDHVSGTEAFYAYNQPYGSSSNTGFELEEADLLYFVVDDAGDVSFVVVHDKAGDPTGGQINIELNAPDLIGQGVTLSVRDDPGADKTREECEISTAFSDCYTWDQAEMTGYFNQIWASCCTDGFALSSLPLANWRFNFKYDVIENINQFKVGNFDHTTNEMHFLDLDAAEVRASGVEVSALTCSDYCASKGSCGECSLDPQCGWCDTEGCLSRSNADVCSGNYIQDECCPSCSVHEDCQSCMNADGCGWSYSLGRCLSGTTELGLCEASEFYQIQQEGSAVCRVLPGPIISPDTEAEFPSVYNSPILDWCSGNGDYTWGVSTTCDCHEGWAGEDCSIECPRDTSGQLCGGHGTCDKAGFCLCECGWGGAAGDCSEEIQCDCQKDGDVERCYINEEESCPIRCGVVAESTQACTGVDVDFHSQGVDRRVSGSQCVCAQGWWGEACDNACPGIDPVTGEGQVCDGNGVCDVSTGACECAPCYTPDKRGNCVPKSCPSCQNGGRCECDADSGERVCRCPGQRYGQLCEYCACENGGCNDLTGQCDCDEGWSGELCTFQCTRESKCHGNGDCNQDTGNCECDEYYVGNADHQCEFYCPPSKCNGHGFCDGETGECVCQAGYTGESCVAACELDVCKNGATCTMDESDSRGYTCGCSTGYTGEHCEEDIDECAGNVTNGCDAEHGTCSNTVGSYECSCEAGYELASNGQDCQDVDECSSAELNECDAEHGTCSNTAGSYECSCEAGYELASNGQDCQDVDECSSAELNECDAEHGTCSNTVGSYECSCEAGYELASNGQDCQDVNECSSAELNECDAEFVVCNNTAGSYQCDCQSGFQLEDDGLACVDVDECTSDPCDARVGTCNNTVGSYECSCADGYSLDASDGSCSDIDECSSGTHECSHYCTNTAGSYQCTCPDGFVLDSSGHNCYFSFSTPVAQTTTTTTPAATTTAANPPTTRSSSSSSTSRPAPSTSTGGGSGTTPAAGTTTGTGTTSAAGPVQVVLKESLYYANLNCTPGQEHLELAEAAGVYDVVLDAFSSIASAADVTAELQLLEADQAIALEYSVTVASEDVAASEAVTHEVALQVTSIMQGIEERDEADCVFFVDIDFTRDSDKDTVPPTDNKQSGSDDGDIPLFVFAGVGAVIVLTVLVVVATGATRRNRQGTYGFTLSAAKDVEHGDFDNPMHSTRERNVAFDNPIYDDLDDGDQPEAGPRSSLEWDTY